MRKSFEMSQADMDALLDASKPTICMKIGDYAPATPQENANRAWDELGRKLGFLGGTAQPIVGKSHRHFTAEVSEVK